MAKDEYEQPSLEEIFADIEEENPIEDDVDEVEETQEEESLEQLLRRINNEPEEVSKGELKFEFISDIGKEDHRAFLYYTLVKKRPILSKILIASPLICALTILIDSAGAGWLLALIVLILLYAIMVGSSVFRIERKLKNIEKNTPDVLQLTTTKMTFYEGKIFNLKKGKHISVGYDQLVKLATTKKMLILYFDNNKAMIIRKEDIDPNIQADFINFIQSKLKGRKSK